jgi:hypothetical protein
MRAIVLYRPDSEVARTVEEYAKEFEKTQHKTLELVSLNTPKGVETAGLYDMLQNPSFLVLRDDGQLVKDWQGVQPPLMSELSNYLSL